MTEQIGRKTFLGRLGHFFHTPLAGGVVLIFFTVIALVLSNLESTGEWYAALWHTDFTVGLENFSLSKPLELWINDALMAIFFFAVGLEIKREIVAGELRSLSQASLPIAAAVGGMLVPAFIYFMFNDGQPSAGGWGIPMATDIAFALGILSMMGSRVPVSLKIFLTALAIVDDLGAILVIAIFYSSQLDWAMLIAAGIVFVLLVTLARTKVYKMRWYVIPAIALWVLFLKSGIHATIAGVLIAMTIPTSAKYSKEKFYATSKKLVDKFKEEDVNHVQVLNNDDQREILVEMRDLARNTMPPAQRLEHMLHPVVAFFIMPLFALCNAGVVISSEAASAMTSPQSMGIIWGLVLGKPIGIMLFSFIVLKLGIAAMPTGANYRTLFGVSCLGGIGFTMSIFINNLAFTDMFLISEGKISILVASVLAACVGSIMLILTSRKSNLMK